MGDNVTSYSGSFSIKLWNCQKNSVQNHVKHAYDVEI